MDAVLSILAAIGLRADPAWAAANCRSGVPPGTAAQDLLASSLSCDLKRIVSGGALPVPLGDAPTTLVGPVVLQIVRADDVSQPLQCRSNSIVNAGRALKLILTDGYNEIAAFEWRRIPSIPLGDVVGAKIICKNVPLRHGLLLLSPENALFVGGSIDNRAESPEV